MAQLISHEASPSQVREEACPASPHPLSQVLGQGGCLLGFPPVQVTKTHTPPLGPLLLLTPYSQLPNKSHGNGAGAGVKLGDASLRCRQATVGLEYMGVAVRGSLRTSEQQHTQLWKPAGAKHHGMYNSRSLKPLPQKSFDQRNRVPLQQ